MMLGIPDNQGNQPIDTSIRLDGEAVSILAHPYQSNGASLKKKGYQSVSNTTGTFVCNHLMYQALYLADKKFPHMRAVIYAYSLYDRTVK